MKTRLEYHLYAVFPSNGGTVRIGVFLSERTARDIGNAIFEFADEVYYKVKPRRPDTKPYRKPRHWPRTPTWPS